jgi:hypothetical protein
MKHNVISEQNEQNNGSNRHDRKQFSRKKLCWLLFIAFVIITVLLFFAANIYHKPDLNELLIRARLAKLPESIKNLQFETRPVMDNDPGEPKARYLFILFQAESNDIDNFINSSPGVDKDHFRPLRPMPDSDEVPTWWPTDDSSGRMYFLEGYKREYITGTVAVYDDSNTVRICARYMVNPQLLNMQEDIEDMRDAFEDFIDDMLREVLDLFD